MESEKFAPDFPLSNLVTIPTSLHQVNVPIPAKEDGESINNQDDVIKYSAYSLGYMDRGRRPKFSVIELESLVSGVESHKNVILPPNGMGSYQGSLSSSQARQNSWKDILATVNAVSEMKRSLPEVVKRWRYLKSRTRVKARRLTKWDKPLTPLQKRILDTVGDLDDSLNGGDGENYEEDGWDECYEVDVEGAMNDEEPQGSVSMEYSQQPPSRKMDTHPQIVDRKTYAMEQEDANVNHQSPIRPSQNVIYVAAESPEVNTGQQHGVRTITADTATRHPRNNFVTNHIHRTPSTIEKRPPSIQERHEPAIVNDKHSAVEKATADTKEKVNDNSNVNITVQSCSCHRGDHIRNFEEERLEIEKRRLDVEQQRLEVEKQRLELERERLQLKKEKTIT